MNYFIRKLNNSNQMSVPPVKSVHEINVNPLIANPTKWSNTLKQYLGCQGYRNRRL